MRCRTSTRPRSARFYGRLFGWKEIESLRLADRLTLAIGGRCYVNLREIPDSMTSAGYEHFGVLVERLDVLERLWSELDAEENSLDLTPIADNGGGVRTFRFRHLLPLAVEVQLRSRRRSIHLPTATFVVMQGATKQ